jgi:hypothetical protein
MVQLFNAELAAQDALCARRAVPDSSRVHPANDRETSRNDGNGRATERAAQRPDSVIVAGPGSEHENTLKEETAHLLLIPTRRVRQSRISLIRWPRPTRATPPHPPNGIGDGGQLDAREDLSLRSATHTTSSLVPEGKPLLRSAWLDVARGTSTCPLRSLQVPASCRRRYSSELTLHLIEVSITHVEEMGTSVVGKLSQELTTREARTVAATRRVRSVPKPPRDHRGTHLVGALVRPPETAFYLQLCSSGGGTRTHNLRINSPPLCQLSYPGSEPGQSSSGLSHDRARLCVLLNRGDT